MICRHLFTPIAVVLTTIAMATSAVAAIEQHLPEPGEALPGGSTTHHKQLNINAFSQSSANMSFENELNFKLGNGIFKKIWVPAPSSTTASDGLGPLYNARSCQRCHLKDGRGHPPEANWPEDNAVSMFLRLSIPPQNDAQRQLLDSGKASVIPEPTYGGQLQDLAINGLAGEGRMVINYSETTVTLADGAQVRLRHPEYSISNLSYGPLHPQTMLSPRVAPPMIGLGLLEAIDLADIEALADPDDANKDGISGRPNRVWNSFTQQQDLGRFGWKAGNPTLIQQAVGAFSGDMGISTPFAPTAAGDCTNHQTDCLRQPDGNTPLQDNAEASAEMVKLVEFYSRNLAPPARPDFDKPTVLQGKAVFHQSGCAACHQPSFTTASREDMPEQSDQLIWPYTDLLLHDMGEGLADHRPEFLASGSEWKTPPLWGIGLTKTVSGHSYFLHDGRAKNLLEAVLWHGGEGAAARDRVINLQTTERNALMTFLESL
ncbi:di-heme oxidoredictase family protein [Amphritea sp.]|uniref:di-heme oxidoreductase family protein n=1 Tax=Amphritea sp. TaxID=1872502 RepID=UPI0025B7F1C9|nr:di-heme oxidoredictase family protein [Amphritea sp.]